MVHHINGSDFPDGWHWTNVMPGAKLVCPKQKCRTLLAMSGLKQSHMASTDSIEGTGCYWCGGKKWQS